MDTNIIFISVSSGRLAVHFPHKGRETVQKYSLAPAVVAEEVKRAGKLIARVQDTEEVEGVFHSSTLDFPGEYGAPEDISALIYEAVANAVEAV